MQIRPDNDILAQYGSPSRPISPTFLSTTTTTTTTTTGNEPTPIENQSTESQPGREQHLQQQHSATLPSQFPPELIDHIVDHLHDDKQSLIHCSRTSRVFSHATSYHLFRAVSIPSVRQCVAFQALVWSSFHPPSSTSTPQPSSSPTVGASSSPRATHHQITQSHPHSALHHDHTNVHSHTPHTCTSDCDASPAGWDISKFVRKIEFLGLDPLSSIEEYASEAVKLVRMLPRIREVAFGWWSRSTGMQQIGRAFAAISAVPSHHGHECLPNKPSTSTNTLPETKPTSDPLKLRLDLVDFESVHTFLDFLESFGERLRELSLKRVGFGGGGDGRNDITGRFLPGIKSVCLNRDAVVKPKGFGQRGPIIGHTNLLFGISAIHKIRDVCDILESIAPNVNELHLFGDDVGEVQTLLGPGDGTTRTLRLPRFRKLKLVSISAPGRQWSDLICEIAAWFAKDKPSEEIADLACRDGRASPPSSVMPSPPSSDQPVKQPDLRKGRKRTRVKFLYPVRTGDVDWKKLGNAVLGEDIMGSEGQDGGRDCSLYGNHGGAGRERGGSGNGNDHVDEMLMKINQGGNQVAGGSCKSARFMAGSLWVEVASGSAVLGDLRRELGRLDRLGLLQVSCR